MKESDAERDLKLAIEHVENMRLTQAEPLLRNLLANGLEHWDEWFLLEWLGTCLYLADRLDEAEEALLRSKKLLFASDEDLRSPEIGPGVFRILNKLGQCREYKGDRRGALEHFAEAAQYLSIISDDAWAYERSRFHRDRGVCALYIREYDEALTYFFAALHETTLMTDEEARADYESRTFMEIARTYVFMREPEESTRYLERVEPDRLYPAHKARFYETYMRLSILKEDYAVAIFYFGKLERHGIPEGAHADFLYMVAYSYYNLADYKKAREYFERALEHEFVSAWMRDESLEYLQRISLLEQS